MGEMADLLDEQTYNYYHLPETHRRPPKRVWVTRQGKRINVRDMEDRHIVNCIAMLNRNIIRPGVIPTGHHLIQIDEHNRECEHWIKILSDELWKRETKALKNGIIVSAKKETSNGRHQRSSRSLHPGIY